VTQDSVPSYNKTPTVANPSQWAASPSPRFRNTVTDLEEASSSNGDMDEEIGGGEGGRCCNIRSLCVEFCGCCQCCRRTKFDTRVDAEVTKAVLAVTSRKTELEGTLSVLKKRLDKGDTSAREPHDAAVLRYQLFRREWHLDSGWLAKRVKKSMRSKVREKIREDMRLADAIELEFEGLDEDMKEMRLLEYVRVMKLSKLERRIYFANRLEFETELAPVSKAKKVFGWIIVIVYCVSTAFYVCLFGVSKGAQTTNAWLASLLLAFLQDSVLSVPLRILFMNVYLPGLISKKLASIADPTKAAEAGDFKFDSFMPESAAVYVAMHHEYLHASKLILHREKASKVEQQAAAEKEKEQFGTGAPAESTMLMYTVKGATKFGLWLFAAFILLPDIIQVSVLDGLIPLGVGFMIYGNYQLYRLREWSPFIVNILLVAIVVGVVIYVRRARRMKKLKWSRHSTEKRQRDWS
jgi:hypothetical protein